VSRHPYCSYHGAQSSASEQPPLPTRVIDVGSLGSTEEPRLLETKNKSGAYATLSHCWGASQPLVTTKDTFKERQQRLPLRDLPKTFQDAVLLARGLRIRYLWIDSLCIIQDDAKDWQREAAKMASVYYGAHINFAASSANGCYEGCLYECPPALHLGPNLFARHGFGPFRSKEEAFPLNSRGWILQESVLSRRTIHLARNQVYWECCSHEECEDGCWTFDQDLQAEKPNYLTHPTKLLHYLRHTFSDSNFGKDLTRAKIYELWNNLMNQYCKRSLTYEKDRIPALAGINQLFQEILADRPIAGLWETELHIGLCWKSCRDLPTDPMPGVPSWSWLSQSWPAKPQLLNYYPVDIWLCGAKPKDFTGTLQIKSARVFWTGPMFTSRMAGGEIVALARIKEVSVEYMSTCPPLGHISRHNFLDKSLSRLYIGECDLDLRPNPGKIWCLEIGTQSCEPQQRTITLAIQQVDNVPGVYRRIGIGHIRDHRWIAGEEWQEIHLV
jgi:Heterokaryon incompatibility protein (HET)